MCKQVLAIRGMTVIFLRSGAIAGVGMGHWNVGRVFFYPVYWIQVIEKHDTLSDSSELQKRKNRLYCEFCQGRC